jgi:hypothetical protein
MLVAPIALRFSLMSMSRLFCTGSTLETWPPELNWLEYTDGPNRSFYGIVFISEPTLLNLLPSCDLLFDWD